MESPLIAVVEDDVPTLEMLDMLLSSVGYRTLLWPRAADAHLKIRETKPDLVLLDMWLEGHESGKMVLHDLEADTSTRDIPVLLCSAHMPALQEQEPRLREKGFGVLAKPFPIDDLLQAIETLLPAIDGPGSCS